MGRVLPPVIRVLLDTHVFIWALAQPWRLSSRLRTTLSDPDVARLVSAVTTFEIAQLVRLGRLPDGHLITSDYYGNLERLGAVELPLSSRHAMLAGSFPQSHKDPFDRMLAAQGILEGLLLATADSKLADFGVTVIW